MGCIEMFQGYPTENIQVLDRKVKDARPLDRFSRLFSRGSKYQFSDYKTPKSDLVSLTFGICLQRGLQTLYRDHAFLVLNFIFT